MSNVFKALSDPTRRRILQLLRDRDLTAGEIAGQFVVYSINLSALQAALGGFLAYFDGVQARDARPQAQPTGDDRVGEPL